jgi:ABC-type lipoprotein release transport system permease subunit
MKHRRIVTGQRTRTSTGPRSAARLRGLGARLFLWESLVLGVFGAFASVVVGVMAAGVLNSANIQVPLALQLFLMSDTFELSVLPGALGGAIALIALVTGAHAWAHRAFRLRA